MAVAEVEELAPLVVDPKKNGGTGAGPDRNILPAPAPAAVRPASRSGRHTSNSYRYASTSAPLRQPELKFTLVPLGQACGL